MNRASKPKTKRVVLPQGAVVWKPGDPLPKPLQDEVERQVEDFNRREEEHAGEQLTNFCGPAHLNVSEVLFNVFYYLQNRAKPLTFSKNHNSGPIDDLLAEIVAANKLPPCRNLEDQPKMEIPTYLDDYANGPLASRPYTEEEIYGIIRPLVEVQSYATQNRLIATLLSDIDEIRSDEHHQVTGELQQLERKRDELNTYSKQLYDIVQGDVPLLTPIRSTLVKRSSNG